MAIKLTIPRVLEVTGAFFSSLILPIHDFVLAIGILATLNIFFGLAEDKFRFSFSKAFKSFYYLIGYLFLLIMSVLYGQLMHIVGKDIIEFTSWITWVMIWFYATNILKNWNKMQPDNKVIAFLYWVVSFKVVEKLKFLKEFNEKDKENENKIDNP